MELHRFQKEWRRKNRHNQTYASSVFPEGIVSVGKHSYGMLNLYSYYPAVEKLVIGNLVSIAPEVKFILGGNHPTNTLTCFPFKSFYAGNHQAADAQSKGPIIVEDEVWIGMGAIILSGVTISKGAIIGAGAVVTQNVPPYAVVGGNPAKIIKYRFPAEIIGRLIKLNLTQLPDAVLKKNMDLIYRPLNSMEETDKILQILNKQQQTYDRKS